MSELESESSSQNELNYLKQVLSQDSNETKTLDLRSDKQNDTILVVTPTFKNKHQSTKQNIFSELASVYDPVRLVFSRFFDIRGNLGNVKEKPTRKTCFSREMKRLALSIYLAKFCISLMSTEFLL